MAVHSIICKVNKYQQCNGTLWSDMCNGNTFVMAVQVPNAWREDPKWKGPQGAGNRKGYAHKADYPSRWIPAKGRRQSSVDDYDGLESQQAGDIWVMDYLLVPKVRPQWT